MLGLHSDCSAPWLAVPSSRVWKCEDRPKGTETARQPGQDECAGGLYSPSSLKRPTHPSLVPSLMLPATLEIAWTNCSKES